MQFQDRREAGKELGAALRKFADTDAVVLALPRGGVPVGFEVSQALHAPLDVFVVRKLGVPGQEELAMGAIASGGVCALNREVIDYLNISPEDIEVVRSRETRELERRERLYRGDRPPLDVRGRVVILVDDGLATGTTMRAAVSAIRELGARRVVAAIPVGAVQSCRQLKSEVDDLVCLLMPEDFAALSVWYSDFRQTTDQEVQELLKKTAPATA
jgi:predicted phosphoribosyltransferase